MATCTGPSAGRIGLRPSGRKPASDLDQGSQCELGIVDVEVAAVLLPPGDVAIHLGGISPYERATFETPSTGMTE